MDQSDGACTPPCKRCRRESKQCTVPPLKRKRYALESASTWTPAKRQQAKQSIEAVSRPSSPTRDTLPGTGLGKRDSADKSAPTLASTQRSNKRQRTAEPQIRDIDTSDDAFITSAAAPWALDFLPVTFCGMIADLSQAYGDQTSSASSEMTSPPSTADGDERVEPERATSPEGQEEPAPQTVAMADMHVPALTKADHVSTRPIVQGQNATDKRQEATDVSYGKDLGLDDIFDYFRFD